MEKENLKVILKPLIKQCIKECILEEGVLSGIIIEVAKGMESQRMITEGITVKPGPVPAGPDPAEEQSKPDVPGAQALAGVAPNDSGVDISGIMALSHGKWKDLV